MTKNLQDFHKKIPSTPPLPIVVILAGGKGERFWPRSRKKRPKQLQSIYSQKTLLEETIERAHLLTTSDRIFIGCNPFFRDAICEVHPNLSESGFIIEPEGRNTAPMIALASVVLNEKFPEGENIQIILPADHYISPSEQFVETMQKAMEAARKNFLVSLGITPKRPDTQYGYIHSGEDIQNCSGVQKILSFKEKPDISTAKEYFSSGNYFWNAGIFVWSSKTILKEFYAHASEMIEPLLSVYKEQGQGDELARVFSNIPAIPFDIAIMEKSRRTAVVPAYFRWDDLGSWTSLERILEKDIQGNVLFSRQNTHLLGIDSQNNIIATDQGLVALLGVEDIVLVQEEDILFVARRDSIDRIKELLVSIRENTSLQKYLD